MTMKAMKRLFESSGSICINRFMAWPFSIWSLEGLSLTLTVSGARTREMCKTKKKKKSQFAN